MQHLSPSERTPLHTSSYGVGELINHACKLGATEIIIGLGGSSTNDAGMGMAKALGWRFLDDIGKDCEQFLPLILPSLLNWIAIEDNLEFA